MNPRTIKSLTRQIERKKAALAKLRDEIRDIESEAETLGQDAQEAIDALQDATDAMSRLV